MRNLFLSLLYFIAFNCQSSMATMCLSGDSTYQIILNENETSAQVLKGLEAVRFGELVCNEITHETDQPLAKLWCHSTHVADAGFQATFFSDNDNNITSVNLNEIFFLGAKRIATLPCLDVLGNLQKRVLWINGENNIDGIDVAANGEIEINIKTTSGTGYSWELQKPLIPNTVTLIADPEFIPTSELAGGVGVTRFRFRVNSDPNRGFTMFFQLRRPWEDAPIKQFHIRFNSIRD